MKKYFKKAVLLLVGMVGHGIAMDRPEIPMPRQMIVVPKTQGAPGIIYKDTMGEFLYYDSDSSFCAWEEAESDLNDMREAAAKKQLALAEAQKPALQWCYCFNGPRLFSANTFHFLVTMPTLNDRELIGNANNYFAYNGRDNQGHTPLHILTVRPDARIAHVDALLQRGADPTIRTNIKLRDGRYVFGDYACESVIEYRGQSPADKLVGRFFKDQCVGNEAVIKYVFSVTLQKRIEELKKEALKRLKKAKYEKAVKYKGGSPADENIGTFFDQQCDAKTIKKLFSEVLYAKLEKLHKQQLSGVDMKERQKKLQKRQCRREEVEKKRRVLRYELTT